MRENRLTTSKGISLPNLKSLFLVRRVRFHCFTLTFSLQAANMLTKLEDLENLTRLTTLHLRDNKIETLDGFSENMKQLQYVNLR
jgi:hypothetical protein